MFFVVFSRFRLFSDLPGPRRTQFAPEAENTQDFAQTRLQLAKARPREHNLQIRLLELEKRHVERIQHPVARRAAEPELALNGGSERGPAVRELFR